MRILKNGAEVILEAPVYHSPDQTCVLARWDRGSHVELVSWYVDRNGNAECGRYLDEAVPAFCKRSGLDEQILRRTFDLDN